MFKKLVTVSLTKIVIFGLIISLSIFGFSGEAYADWQCRLLSPSDPTNFNNFLGEGFGITQDAAKTAATNDCLRRNSQAGCSFGVPSYKWVTPPPPPPQTRACVAYEHGWLNGSEIVMKAGEKVDLRNKSLNDEVSSTWTAPNCKLAVYEHSGFQGYLMDLGPGQNLTLGINDRISSMECKCR